MKKLAILGLAALFAACADTPTQPATDIDLGPQLFYNLTTVGNTDTHDFNELSGNCEFGVAIPDPYEGLDFLTPPYLAACPSPNGTTAVVPSDYSYNEPFELQFDLANPATAVSIQSYDGVDGAPYPPVLNAYNAAGDLVDTSSDPTTGAWVTLSVTGDISRVGLLMPQGYHYLDNLTITYVPEDPEPEPDPQSKADCMKGGWEALGFKNQGQCIRFVQTGKDSR